MSDATDDDLMRYEKRYEAGIPLSPLPLIAEVRRLRAAIRAVLDAESTPMDSVQRHWNAIDTLRQAMNPEAESADSFSAEIEQMPSVNVGDADDSREATNPEAR